MDGLVDHELGALLGRPPAGWVRRQLLDERCLLLVDGVDEVSAEHRPAVRGWLTDLMTAYPRARVVVTSCPSGVADDWLDDEGFRNIRLEPMNLVEHIHGELKNYRLVPVATSRFNFPPRLNNRPAGTSRALDACVQLQRRVLEVDGA